MYIYRLAGRIHIKLRGLAHIFLPHLIISVEALTAHKVGYFNIVGVAENEHLSRSNIIVDVTASFVAWMRSIKQ